MAQVFRNTTRFVQPSREEEYAELPFNNNLFIHYTMDMDFKVAEVTLTIQNRPAKNKAKVFGSEEAYNILLPTSKREQ